MTMNYNSRRYAFLNTPIEIDRHLRRIERYLSPREDDRILDVGSGRGFLTERMRRIAPRTVGIDLNPQAVANAVVPGIRLMDAQRLEFPDASFDLVYSFHAIEHVPDVAAVFHEIDRVLRPGGKVLLVYPAEPIRGLYVVPTALVLFGNPWRARDLHLHRLTPRRLAAYASGTTLEVTHSSLDLLITPQFITVLRKPCGLAAPTPRRRTRRPLAAQHA